MVAHDSKLSFSYKQPMVRLAIRDARPSLAMMKAKPSEAVVKSIFFWPLLMKAQGIVKAGQSPAMAVVETCFLLRLSKCQLILVLSLKGNTENFKFYLKKSKKDISQPRTTPCSAPVDVTGANPRRQLFRWGYDLWYES